MGLFPDEQFAGGKPDAAISSLLSTPDSAPAQKNTRSQTSIQSTIDKLKQDANAAASLSPLDRLKQSIATNKVAVQPAPATKVAEQYEDENEAEEEEEDENESDMDKQLAAAMAIIQNKPAVKEATVPVRQTVSKPEVSKAAKPEVVKATKLEAPVRTEKSASAQQTPPDESETSYLYINCIPSCPYVTLDEFLNNTFLPLLLKKLGKKYDMELTNIFDSPLDYSKGTQELYITLLAAKRTRFPTHLVAHRGSPYYSAVSALTQRYSVVVNGVS
jgi:hypothetical protein